MAKKKSFLDKVATKTTNKLADKVSSGIVKGLTTKPKLKKGENSTADKNSAKKPADEPKEDPAIRYNTKRCPECQALCFNAPLTCPYCDADLKGVKPLTPKEFDELNG